MIVLIDNYDSFTYNLVQRIGELDARREVRVFRNNKVTLDQIAECRPDHIIISPGPCTPNEAGISIDVVREFASKVPLLGVCLGHQAIAQAFGATIVRARRLMHGKTSPIRHDGHSVFEGLPNPFTATRYHSLIVDPPTLPDVFEVSARTDNDDTEIMGIRHKQWPVAGVQFHPESFLTDEGPRLLMNFLEMA